MNSNAQISESKHCPVASDCRKLLDIHSKVQCHRQVIAGAFDVQDLCDVKCKCCYACIVVHSKEGCDQCTQFLDIYLPSYDRKRKLSKSAGRDLKEALSGLFSVLGLEEVKVEERLSVSIESFIADYLTMVDEVKTPGDICRLWHLSFDLADWIFTTMKEVLYSGDCLLEEDDDLDEETDFGDDESDESVSSDDEASVMSNLYLLSE